MTLKDANQKLETLLSNAIVWDVQNNVNYQKSSEEEKAIWVMETTISALTAALENVTGDTIILDKLCHQMEKEW
jgi:hypothetical protein